MSFDYSIFAKRLICVLCSTILFSSLHAATPPPPNPNMPPQKTNPNLWPQDFHPETQEERIDTDTSTDEDVIIMEEDEESEHVPGNADNVSS